jgi:Recombinase
MSLSRRRRRKQEQRRHHEARPPTADGSRDVSVSSFSPERLFEQRAQDKSSLTASRQSGADDERDVDEAGSSTQLGQADGVERLAYTRRQAAEALGVSISTIDRYVVPIIETIKTPWGQRLIPADELDRLLRKYREPARGRPAPRPAGRRPVLPRSVVERIRLEYARGRGLSEIARLLTSEGVPTAHGGRKWWPSTVRAVLVRSITPAV